MELIIGASGYIGGNIFGHLFKMGKQSIGTYYSSPKKDLRYFDLKNPRLDSLNVDLSQVNHAIICSARTKIMDCEENWRETYELNVTGTKKLIENLFEKNISPIFLSSDRVFDGRKGNYDEKDTTSPYYNYGRHKKAIEDFLLGTKQNYTILRLSRVFGLAEYDKTLLTTLAGQLKRGETIRCADDQRFSLTYIGDLIKIIEGVLARNLYGVCNIASIGPFSRFELVKIIKKELKIDSGEIIPCSIRDFGFFDPLPSDLSMNNEKIKRCLNMHFPDIYEYLKKLS